MTINNKNALKTYFFLSYKVIGHSVFTGAPSLIPVWRRKEDRWQKRLCEWVPDVFSCKKRPKKIFHMQQSNVPSDLKTGLEPLNNQPKSFSGRRQKEYEYKEKKTNALQWATIDDNQNLAKSWEKQQSNIPFSGLKRRKWKPDYIYHVSIEIVTKRGERKKERKKERAMVSVIFAISCSMALTGPWWFFCIIIWWCFTTRYYSTVCIGPTTLHNRA